MKRQRWYGRDWGLQARMGEIATGHADRSGPDDYNMALSLRRANAVKDALVRDGVPVLSPNSAGLALM